MPFSVDSKQLLTLAPHHWSYWTGFQAPQPYVLAANKNFSVHNRIPPCCHKLYPLQAQCVCSCVCAFVCSRVRVFVCSRDRVFVHPCVNVRAFVRSCVLRSCVLAFVRSCIRHECVYMTMNDHE